MTPAGPGDTIAQVKNALLIFAASILVVAACGARTGLPLASPDAGTGGTIGTGGIPGTGGTGGTGGVPLDAGPDVVDAPFDAPPDVVDAPPDAPIVDDCVDAGITYVYLIGSDTNMYRFYPPTRTTTLLGPVNCPGESGGPGVNSMAVDRAGIAYVNFQDGQLFRVSTLTLSCEATGFVPNQGGFASTYGMAFSADVTDPGEKLFVAGLGTTQELANIDTTSFKLSPVGTFTQPIGDSELTGSGAGDLYAFGVDTGTGAYLARLDKANASIYSEGLLTLATPPNEMITDWAFAYWGGDFYFFTSTDFTTSIVSEYTPGGPLTLPVVANITESAIVGAGVSTCAPHP